MALLEEGRRVLRTAEGAKRRRTARVSMMMRAATKLAARDGVVVGGGLVEWDRLGQKARGRRAVPCGWVNASVL